MLQTSNIIQSFVSQTPNVLTKLFLKINLIKYLEIKFKHIKFVSH